MLTDLAMVDADHPDGASLVNLLHLLESISMDSAVERVARWAMRMLDQVLFESEYEIGTSIPVLAKFDDFLIFDPAPYVSNDPLAEQVWRDAVPIYAGDRRLQALVEALRLPRLEDELRIEAALSESDDAATTRAATRFRKTMPYLLAAATQVAQSEQDDFATRLLSINLNCGSQLTLVFELDGELRESSSPAYIEDNGIGDSTAYLAIEESGTPDWLSFGPLLARKIGVEELADSFALIMESGRVGLSRYLNAKGVTPDNVADAEEALIRAESELSARRSESSIAEETEETEETKETGDKPKGWSNEVIEQDAELQSESDTFAGIGQSGRSTGKVSGGSLDRDAQGQENDRGPREANGKPPQGSSQESKTETSTPSKPDPNPWNRQQENDDRRPRGRFFSYVLPTEPSAPDGVRRLRPVSPEVNRCGVDRVLEHELEMDRFPEEQTHSNPGFDVKSFNPDGSLARIIEVKSLSEDWSEQGVTLSKRQLVENQERGDEFWLYVVEYATDDSRARIITIRNPFDQCGSFVFDQGWEALSSED